MTIRGHVQNGVIILDDPEVFPEESTVMVEEVQLQDAKKIVPSQKTKEGLKQTSAPLELFEDFIGMLDEFPEDIAENHDHYLYGSKKR